MADVRVVQNVVISDPTTPSQIAAVDASGRLSVSLTASSATVTVDSELPAAAALADNTANPTVPGVGAFVMGYDGTNWDRVRADSGSVWVQGNVASDAAVTANPLLAGGRASTAVPTAVSADGDAVAMWLDRQGAQKMVMVDDAGDSAMDGTNNALRVNVVAGSSGGPSKVDDAAFTVATDSVAPMGALADEVTPDSVDEGDVGIPRMTLDRKLLVRVVGATDANRLDIDASGRVTVQGAAAADAAVAGNPLLNGGRASSAVPTAMSADGDAVSLWLDRSGGVVTNGRDAHDAALDANTNPKLIGGRASAAAPTDVSADGDAVRAWFLRNGAQTVVVTAAGALIGGDAANGLDVDVTRVTGTVTVDTEFPAASQITTDDITAPTAPAGYAYLMGFDNTDGNWDRVRVGNDTGRLQVDVVTGGGSDTPTSPVNSYDTTASVAAGSTDNHDTADLGGLTRKVAKCIFGASVALKVELFPVINGVAQTTLAVGFSPAGGMGELVPSHRDFWSQAFTANAGFDGFRLVRTNLDASEAADVYSTIQYEA